MKFINRFYRTKKKAPKAAAVPELTPEQKSDILRVFDRVAILKVYDLNEVAAGYRDATEVKKMTLQSAFERIAAAEEVGVSFQDALSFMIKEGFIVDAPEKKNSSGRPMGEPVYILTRKMLYRYLDRVKFSPEREQAVCKALVLGLEFFTPGVNISKVDILHAIKKGLHKAGYIELDNIGLVFMGLVTGDWLLINDIPIYRNFRIHDQTCTVFPSEKFVKKYNLPSIWGKRYEPTPAEQISEMEKAYWRGRAKAQSKISISQVQPLP